MLAMQRYPPALLWFTSLSGKVLPTKSDTVEKGRKMGELMGSGKERRIEWFLRVRKKKKIEEKDRELVWV